MVSNIYEYMWLTFMGTLRWSFAIPRSEYLCIIMTSGFLGSANDSNETGGPIAVYLNDLDFFGLASWSGFFFSFICCFFSPFGKAGFWSWATISNVAPHQLFLEVLRWSKLTSEPEIVSEVISESGYLVMAMILKANRNNRSLGL